MSQIFSCEECGRKIPDSFELESGEWIEEAKITGGVFMDIVDIAKCLIFGV